jgi:hypothetical protein
MKTEDMELREAIADLVDEEDEIQPTRHIKVKQAKPDDRVAVKILPNHEQIIMVLRELEKEEFDKVIRAAKQYRKADKTLNS